jgi:hypothetical protein
METTDLAILETVRRTLAQVGGVKMARLVRREERVDVPLSRYAAAIVEPDGTETLAWPDVPVGAYRLLRWHVEVLDRALPGTRAFEALVATAVACRAAVASDLSLGGLAEDGPPLPGDGDLAPSVGATRLGPARLGQAAPGTPTAILFDGAAGYWTQEMTGAATLDDESLFASGPHVVEVRSPVRRVADLAFNGLAGGLVLDLGEGPREIVQRGVLSASSDTGLATLEAAIESFIDGWAYPLTAPDGGEYPNCRLERFERIGSVLVGVKWHQPYRIAYRQMVR